MKHEITILEIARLALDSTALRDKIADELDLSDEAIQEIHEYAVESLLS